MSSLTAYNPRNSTSLRRRRILFRLGTLLFFLATLPKLTGHRIFVINTSPSVAPGLYVRSPAEPAVGQIVDFRIPLAARPYVQARTGYDGKDWYILKPIVAGPGDRLDTTGAWLTINGHRVAPMPHATDSMGRPLPIWRNCRVLDYDEFFVFSDRIPNSFDSRCYGPIRYDEIEAVRKPLITR